MDQLFKFYDNLISPLSLATQATISLVLLVILIWELSMIIKSGHWIFIVALIITLPGTWPAAKNIVALIWMVIKFLFIRAQLIIGS